MSGSGVKIDGLREISRGLLQAGVELNDLKDAFGDIAARGANLAASFAPRRSGKLAASIRGDRAKNRATVRAGSAKVPYSGAVNYGWRSRGIEPSLFMQKADDKLRPTVADDLEAAIMKLLSQRGLA